MSPHLRVVAIVSAYNEEDVIEQVLTELIAHQIDVYFIDDGSTDGTGAVAEQYVGRGVIGLEQLENSPSGTFGWSRILARKEALAEQLDADWIIHHDADEFRESPWPEMTLAQAIGRVDREGYNAIDFALFDFWPTDNGFTAGDDLRRCFPYYETGQDWNRVQIKCWKKSPERVDLVSSGGHEAAFPHRRVYPVRFVLRHYPIRSSVHGRRKVFQERLPRFGAERSRGWHLQYDEYSAGRGFLREPSSMTLYDPQIVRAHLAADDLLKLDQARERAIAEADRLRQELGSAREELGSAREELERARQDLHVAQDRAAKQIEAVYSSRTWRWTRPFRAVYEALSRVTGRTS